MEKAEGGGVGRSPEKFNTSNESLRDKRGFEEYRGRFRLFYQAIVRGHLESAKEHQGHGLDHDVTVAQLAAQIAPDDRTAEKAWCAGMLHSTDRYATVARVSEGAHEVGEEIRQNLGYLPPDYFKNEEINEIYAAACRHDELNQDDQSLVQMALMDADRLANLMPAVVIRAGQSMSKIPAVELEHLNGSSNPESTYHNPKSVLDDLRANLDQYIPQLRLPKAQTLGVEYAEKLQDFIDDVEASYGDLGLANLKL